MKPRSNTLFHFTKKAETLKLILRGGFWPRYCLEDVSWLGYKEFSYVAYPMVCFCDIPLSRISEHVTFYGDFGLGLTREWAEVHGLNPIFYVSGNNSVLQSFRSFNSLADISVDKDLAGKLKDVLREILAFTKPAVGKMSVDGVDKEKVFYQESEWRYVLKNSEVDSYMTSENFHDSKYLLGKDLVARDKFMLKVTPADIRYIFVPRDSDISEMVDFIQQGFGGFTDVELNILVSRVVSLESIRADM